MDGTEWPSFLPRCWTCTGIGSNSEDPSDRDTADGRPATSTRACSAGPDVGRRFGDDAARGSVGSGETGLDAPNRLDPRRGVGGRGEIVRTANRVVTTGSGEFRGRPPEIRRAYRYRNASAPLFRSPRPRSPSRYWRRKRYHGRHGIRKKTEENHCVSSVFFRVFRVFRGFSLRCGSRLSAAAGWAPGMSPLSSVLPLPPPPPAIRAGPAGALAARRPSASPQPRGVRGSSFTFSRPCIRSSPITNHAPLFSTSLSSTASSSRSSSQLMPRSNIRSNSAWRNGGATLFLPPSPAPASRPSPRRPSRW